MTPTPAAPLPAPELILAPLRGYTDAVFRNVFCRHFSGLNRAVAPFIPTVSGPRVRPGLLSDLQPAQNPCLPVTPQIIGKSAEDFLLVARALSDLGYQTVNWNLGCPFPMVMKKGRGCGLLPHPEKIDAFLDRVHAAIAIHVSVKLRLGRIDADEVFDVLPVLNRYPLSEIILHPRTARQMYGGRPDLDRFAAAAAESNHPVVYNGDINTAGDFRRLRNRLPEIHRWMLGRGVLVDPFLPAAVDGREPQNDRRADRFRAFHDDLLEGYRQRLSGPGHLLDRMKGFWKYFGLGFEDGRRTAKQIHRCKALQRYIELVESFFDTGPAWVGLPDGASIDQRIA
ncbi:MAG: tRNA-dihydrouridine synthase family protein [Desulfobacterales bacterium]|jgi:tRNA-dihydrouridine synthase